MRGHQLLSVPRIGRTGGMLLAATAVLAVAGGVAYATIPDSAGVIHGCYLKGIGSLRVIDPSAGQGCAGVEKPIKWSQTGPQGLQGTPGTNGAAGPAGSAGAQGPPGTADAVDTSTVQHASLPFPTDWAIVARLDLPQGHYLVNGSLVADNNGYDNVTYCRLFATNNPAVTGAGNEFGGLAQATVFDGTQGEGETTLPVSGLVNLSAPTTAALECAADPYGNSQPASGQPAGHVLGAYLNAVTVSTVNGG
jgi:hypothetical protein